MPDPAPARTPGRLTRRLSADLDADALRLGVSRQTLLLALQAQVAERDFLLSLQADGAPLHRRQASRLRLLVRLFPLCAGDAQADEARPRPVIPYAHALLARWRWSARCAVCSLFSMAGVSGPGLIHSMSTPEGTGHDVSP